MVERLPLSLYSCKLLISFILQSFLEDQSFCGEQLLQQTTPDILHRNMDFAAGFDAAKLAFDGRNGCLPFHFQPDK
jgi:hypothetical protein